MKESWECHHRSIKCFLYKQFHKLTSLVAIALMEEQKRVSETEVAKFIRKREEQETLHGEWHRSEENVNKVLTILQSIYGDSNTYMVAHHILIQPVGSPRALEIPSVESLIFDPDFMTRCDETDFEAMAGMDKQERLDYLYECITKGKEKVNA